jgi:hypothetical protein
MVLQQFDFAEPLNSVLLQASVDTSSWIKTINNDWVFFRRIHKPQNNLPTTPWYKDLPLNFDEFVQYINEGRWNFEYIIKISAFADIPEKIYPVNLALYTSNSDTVVIPKQCGYNLFIPLYDYKNDRDDEYQITACDDTDAEIETLKQAGMSVMASVWKIHLQVKKEYLISFIRNLITFLNDNTDMCHIHEFKVLRRYSIFENMVQQDGFENCPTIVLYIERYLQNQQEVCAFFDPIIKALINRYQDVIDQIAFTGQPARYSYKINNLIYLAGASSTLKKEYIDLLNAHYLPRNTVFSDDFCFVRGYEYTYNQPA